MWLESGDSKWPELQRNIFGDLYQECRYAPPCAQLSSYLRHRIERLTQNERKSVVSMMRDGCAPLFMACKRGQVEIVEFLITVCGADVEQRGLYEVPDDRSTHCVTPLWCAAVSGKLPVIKCLIKHGADVNAVSDSGSTPVRSACFMTHLDIVQYLVENGADIQKGNYNGGTCLINSVQSVELCVYLLNKGAAVNAQDVQYKTALHYAIQEHRLETVKLLIDHGADPYACSKNNDDALQTACLKGAISIFKYLVITVHYSKARLANAHELIGSTFLDEYNEIQTALAHWEIALTIRESAVPRIEKTPKLVENVAHGFSREFIDRNELLIVADDLDALRMQSLLICERVLGYDHKDTLFRIMYRGAAYADAMLYQRCIDLWQLALSLRIAKDSIFFTDTVYTAYSLVRLYMDLELLNLEWQGEKPNFNDIAKTFTMIAKELPSARRLLQIQPVHRKQLDSFDRMLRCITHLIYLLMQTVENESNELELKQMVKSLVGDGPRSAMYGDTLLHLCSSRLNTCASNTVHTTNSGRSIFPNLRVLRLLLEAGAPVNARNSAMCTPLHIAANSYNYSAELVELLLEFGGHLDLPNALGETPKDLLSNYQLPLVRHETLKCLAANAVVRYQIPYRGQVPSTLTTFVSLHDVHPMKSQAFKASTD